MHKFWKENTGSTIHIIDYDLFTDEEGFLKTSCEKSLKDIPGKYEDEIKANCQGCINKGRSS